MLSSEGSISFDEGETAPPFTDFMIFSSTKDSDMAMDTGTDAKASASASETHATPKVSMGDIIGAATLPATANAPAVFFTPRGVVGVVGVGKGARKGEGGEEECECEGERMGVGEGVEVREGRGEEGEGEGAGAEKPWTFTNRSSTNVSRKKT